MKIGHARKFAQHMAPHVIRPARILWNQVIGVIFLLFAVPALYKAWQYYRALETDSQSAGRLMFALPFGALMAGFGLHAFWRARQISLRP